MMADRQKPDFLLKSGRKASTTWRTETFLISFRKLECARGPFVVFTVECIAQRIPRHYLFFFAKGRMLMVLLGGNELTLFLHITQDFS